MLLRRAIESSLYPVATSAQDSFRADFPFAASASYFDSPAGVAVAGSIVPTAGQRYETKTISLQHSTWLLAGTTSTDVAPTLSAAQQTTLDRTTAVDPAFRTSFAADHDLLSIYIGFDNGVFRSFPGTAGDRVRFYGAYDHRQRSWYNDAVKIRGTSAGFVVSEPYADFQGRGYVLTISAPVEGGGEKGVAACNVLVNSVMDRLNTTAPVGAQVSLWSSSGNAVAHPFWNPVSWTEPRNFRYNDSRLPMISDNLWNSILSSLNPSPNATFSQLYTDPITSTPYALVARRLALPTSRGTSYLFVLSAYPTSAIDAPVRDTSSAMDRALALFASSSLGAFLVVLALVLVLVLSLARASVRPLENLIEESKRISNNIGNKDLFDGVKEGDGQRAGGTRVEETEELERRFFAMVEKVKEAAAKAEVVGTNPYFRNSAMPKWKDVDGVTEMLPDAPPPSYSEAAAGQNGVAGPSGSH
ncbi:hypothetical protein BJ742DRAFT_475654 [Cladochytrium replicatum]|nr:hypothetical protein BJ742DRAFT_475654 [Cladochytrium replicatum]